MKYSVACLLIILTLITIGCAGNQQFRSNVHSGNVPEWVPPAALNSIPEKRGDTYVSVGMAGRMLDVLEQKKSAAEVAIEKIVKTYGADAEWQIRDCFTDRDGNLFVVIEVKEPAWINGPIFFSVGDYLCAVGVSYSKEEDKANEFAEANAKSRLSRIGNIRSIIAEGAEIKFFRKGGITYALARLRAPGK